MTEIKPKMKNTEIRRKSIIANNKRKGQMSTYILDTDYENNTQTVLKYYKEFSKNKIDAVLEEIHAGIKQAEEEGYEWFTDEEEYQFYFYVRFLIAVRFTGLNKDVPTDFGGQIAFMKEMDNDGLTDRIHTEVLDNNEVQKVYDRLGEYTAVINSIMEIGASMLDSLGDTVENKEVLNMFKAKNNPIHPLVNPDA